MQRCEKETLILLNDQDMLEGFVKVSTTKREVAERLIKHLEGKATVVRECKAPDGSITETDLKIPSEFLLRLTNLFSRPSRRALQQQMGRETPHGFKKNKQG
jgi:hypothetical protein